MRNKPRIGHRGSGVYSLSSHRHISKETTKFCKDEYDPLNDPEDNNFDGGFFSPLSHKQTDIIIIMNRL